MDKLFEIIEEHKEMSEILEILGIVIVEALQKNYNYLDQLKANVKIKYIDGKPHYETETLNRYLNRKKGE